jgi:pSer/pThr/pTyr-binding forkhead associated (FHA) protein
MESPAAAHASTPAELAQRLEAERRGLPFLFWRGPEGQRILTLEAERDRVTVGRGPEVDIALDADEQVSRLHAEIERIGGEWTIADDGLSRNGSFLNGERVGGRRRLANGDELRFGATMAVFRVPSPSPSSATIAAPESGETITVTDTQRRILIALSRPFREGSQYAIPATNQQIADEVYLSLDSVKGHLRALFEKFGIGDLPQNQKRVRLVELALRQGVISVRDLDRSG